MREDVLEFLARERERTSALWEAGASDEVIRARTALLEALHEVVNPTAPEPTYTPEEAAALTGMNAAVIRRKVARGELGQQRVKKGAITILKSELVLLRPRGKSSPVLPLQASVPFDVDALATSLVARLAS